MIDATLEQANWIDPGRLDGDGSVICRQPFPFLVVREILSQTLSPRLTADFPRMTGAGYLPYVDADCGPSINQLIQQLTAPAFADALGTALGIADLSKHPTYVSISRTLNKRHGTIHTDGKSKLATLLLYLNEDWLGEGSGCLRFLKRIDDIDATILPEIPPEYGTLVAFKRTENSFHGHLPFEGERRVIQIAWLVSAEDAARKAKRGRLSRAIKKLIGGIDRQLGRGRGDSAYNK